MDIFKLLLILSIFLGFTTNYNELSDRKFNIYKSDDIIINDAKVNLEYFSENDQISYDIIKSQFILNSSLVFIFAQKNSINYNAQCFDNQNLEIYGLKYSTLNELGRFSWKNMNTREINGLFDPRSIEKNVSSLMITEVDTSLALAHETAHYWFDRFCFDRHGWAGTTEDFAILFEKYILEGKQ